MPPAWRSAPHPAADLIEVPEEIGRIFIDPTGAGSRSAGSCAEVGRGYDDIAGRGRQPHRFSVQGCIDVPGGTDTDPKSRRAEAGGSTLLERPLVDRSAGRRAHVDGEPTAASRGDEHDPDHQVDHSRRLHIHGSAAWDILHRGKAHRFQGCAERYLSSAGATERAARLHVADRGGDGVGTAGRDRAAQSEIGGAPVSQGGRFARVPLSILEGRLGRSLVRGAWVLWEGF